MAIFKRPRPDQYPTIPQVLQFHYEHNSDQPAYIFSEDGSDGKDIDSNHLTEIKYLEFIRSCQRAAHLVRPRRSGPDREVVIVIALVDTIVYASVVVGLMEAGLVVS